MFSIKSGDIKQLLVDTEGRHKGGVLILVKNSIPARELKVDTARPPGSENRQAEIHSVVAKVGETDLNIYNLYCPDNKDLSLRYMNITDENCLIVGNFNSHLTSCSLKTKQEEMKLKTGKLKAT